MRKESHISIDRDPLLNELAKIFDKCADENGCAGCFLEKACTWFWDVKVLKRSGNGPSNITAQEFQGFYNTFSKRQFGNSKRKKTADTRN